MNMKQVLGITLIVNSPEQRNKEGDEKSTPVYIAYVSRSNIALLLVGLCESGVAGSFIPGTF